jgi:hypothetical protein
LLLAQSLDLNPSPFSLLDLAFGQMERGQGLPLPAGRSRT